MKITTSTRDKRPRHKLARVPDAVIREIRWLHEEERKTHLQVCAVFPNLSETYVRDVIDYVTRAKVPPQP